jgi:DNA-binding response OmpR family regulator
MNQIPNSRQIVLIIEDERILGEIIFNKLHAEGYEAYWELNGDAGLKKMREVMPGLVLLDLVMPEKNGYEVLEEMKGDPLLQKIPVVIISNSGQPVEVSQILELGAKDYIVKAEFSPEEVLDKVRKYMKKDLMSSQDPAHMIEPIESGAKILVVEDDFFLSSLLSDRLMKEGYKVSVAGDGKHALRILETETPDLMLLDVIMPEMNGFDVLRAMKADERLSKILVIIFSNLSQEHEIEEAKSLGADDFIVKVEFTLTEALKKIDTLLKKKAQRANIN